MRREFARHPIAYSVLVAGLIVLIVLFLAAWPSLFWQRVVILLLGLFYLSWGVMTHVKSEFVSRRVILEYLGVSLLATALLFLVTV